MLTCWQGEVGAVYNIHCATINLSEEIVIYDDPSNSQKNPYVIATGRSTFMLSWEDERNGNYSDLYIQELSSGQGQMGTGGEILCDAVFNQYNSQLNLIETSGSNEASLLLWEDDRSSGKEFVTNIFSQKINDCIGMYDACGICNGPGSIYDCGCADIPVGNCDCLGRVLDDCGECGGNGPHFQCQNACVVCNPTDCIDLDSDCNMDISPYLLPDEFGISKIFPNPFNPVTHIQYELTQFGLISIKIYDIQGRVVDQLMNEYQSPGHYSLNWNAGNHASGMYIVEMVMQLENNDISRDLQKILYLK